MQSPLLYSLV